MYCLSQRHRDRSRTLTVRYSFSTNLTPSSTVAIILLESRWTFSTKKDLSMVIICETLMTLSLGNFDCFPESKTLPGAPDKYIFEVMATTITVLILLLLNSFAWSMSSGLL